MLIVLQVMGQRAIKVVTVVVGALSPRREEQYGRCAGAVGQLITLNRVQRSCASQHSVDR